jgi:multidrug efflux pump subunit AcrA (membrane-fusion protein)
MRPIEPRRLAALACLSLALAGCGETGEEHTGTPEPTITVRTVTPERRRITPTLETYGHAAPLNVTEVATPVEGVVRELPLDEGQRVRRGALLAGLDNTQLKNRLRIAAARVATARAETALARSALRKGRRQCEAHLLALKQLRLRVEQKRRETERIEEEYAHEQVLFEMDGISRKAFLQAQTARDRARTEYQCLLTQLEIDSVGYRECDLQKAGYAVPEDPEERAELLKTLNTRSLRCGLEAAEAELRQARSEFTAAELLCAELTIRSPADGTILRRPVEKGERVRKFEAIATIAQLGAVHVVCRVPEEQALPLEEGAEARVSFDAIGGPPLKGSVDTCAPAVRSSSGNLAVKILVPNSERLLKPGSFARAKIVTAPAREALLLPVSALLRRNETSATVMTIRESRVFERRLAVREGPSGMVEVTEGLNAGESVVDDPPPHLREGQEVNRE